MEMHVFLVMLLACSLLTSLTVEAIKRMNEGEGKRWNVMVAVVAVILAVAIGVAYAVMTGIAVTAQYVVIIIALCFLSWLCAMVGYDKVIQAIEQIFKGKH